MYCPRCGTANTETTKFCRQCGLALQQLTGYIATGGTGGLSAPPPPAPMPPPGAGMSAKQKMILLIMFWVMSPAICGVAAGVTGMGFIFGRLAGLCAVLMPLAIVWTVFHFRPLVRAEKYGQMQPHFPPAYTPPPLPPQQQQPIQYAPQPPAYQTPVSAPPTNPLKKIPGSVIEDETRRLPDK